MNEGAAEAINIFRPSFEFISKLDHVAVSNAPT